MLRIQKQGRPFHTASAYSTFVTLGGNGKPIEVPGLVLETEADRRRYEAGKRRREIRLQNSKSLKGIYKGVQSNEGAS